MRRAALALALVLALTAPAAAQVGINGFETGIASFDCPGGGGSGQAAFETSSPIHGSYDMRTRRDAGAEGSCIAMTGINDTGTFILAGWYRPKLYGAIYCSPTQDASVVEIRNTLASPVATLVFSCTNLGSDYKLGIKTGSGTLVGSRVDVTMDTAYYFEIKVTTGSGSGVVGGRINGVSVGSDATGLTISNVDSVAVDTSSPLGNSSIENHFDSLVLLKTSTYPGAVYVNLRKPDGNGGTNRNQWTKANGGGIAAEWTSPQGSSPPTWAGTTYATSVANDTDGQAATIANFDTGTPTPVIDSATLTDIFGCRLDVWSGRTTGTTRLYAIYNYQPTPGRSLTAVTYAANVTYYLNQQVFSIAGASPSAKLTELNGLEVGGEKTNDTSGANMQIEDVWVQCAWSALLGGSAFQWVQDEGP